MTEFTNGYFKMMRDIGEGYERARSIRKKEKEELIKKDDWDGVDAWNEREKSFPFPFSDGYMKAYWAWKNSIDHSSDAFEVDDLPWEKDAHDFVACLREAGVSEFAITDKSTGLMDVLHALAKEGCQMKGLCEVKRIENNWGEDETKSYNGILMSI